MMMMAKEYGGMCISVCVLVRRRMSRRSSPLQSIDGRYKLGKHNVHGSVVSGDDYLHKSIRPSRHDTLKLASSARGSECVIGIGSWDLGTW